MEIDSAHRLMGDECSVGKCRHLHGHRFKIEVAISGKVNEQGFVVDFKDIKKAVNFYDHAVMLHVADPLVDHIRTIYKDEGIDRNRVLTFNGNPTAENFAERLFYDLCVHFPNSVTVKYVKIWETKNAYAIYRGKKTNGNNTKT